MMKNLLLRTFSALTLGPLFFHTVYNSSNFSYTFFFHVLYYFLILSEWRDMTVNTKYANYGSYIFALPYLSLLMMRMYADNSYIPCFYFLSVWSTDAGSMLGGKLFKGPTITRISPNKTWIGLLSGCLVTGLVSYLYSPLYQRIYDHIMYGFMIGVLGQTSDIFISYYKRKCMITDTGCLIPGHGGLIDRFDSTILTAPYFLVWCMKI